MDKSTITLGILTSRAAVRAPGPLRARFSKGVAGLTQLARGGKSHRLRIAVGRIEEFSFRNRTFHRAWTWSRSWNHHSGIWCDRVLFQTKGRRSHYRYGLTSKRLNDLFRDKWATYRRFKKYQPRTWLVHSTAQANRVRGKVQTERFVLKPRYGSASKGVSVHQSARAISRSVSRDTILQEFVEHAGTRELRGNVIIRVILLNGTPALSYGKVGGVHEPVIGVSRGATRRVIPSRAIPAPAWRMIRSIDRTLRSETPRYYSVDFRIAPDRSPALIELNGSPAFPTGTHPAYAAYYRAFCRFIRGVVY